MYFAYFSTFSVFSHLISICMRAKLFHTFPGKFFFFWFVKKLYSIIIVKTCGKIKTKNSFSLTFWTKKPSWLFFFYYAYLMYLFLYNWVIPSYINWKNFNFQPDHFRLQWNFQHRSPLWKHTFKTVLSFWVLCNLYYMANCRFFACISIFYLYFLELY